MVIYNLNFDNIQFDIIEQFMYANVVNSLIKWKGCHRKNGERGLKDTERGDDMIAFFTSCSYHNTRRVDRW